MTAPHVPPSPYDATRRDHAWQDFQNAALNKGLTKDDLVLDPAAAALMDSLFGNSPYLTGLAVRDPAFMLDILRKGPDAALADTLAHLNETAPDLKDTAALMTALRIAKSHVALLTACADLTGAWPVMRQTGVLSDFAELALDLATAHLLRMTMERGELAPPDGADLATLRATPDIAKGSGFFVLGMGKLGARELNYSSDIDLIVLHDGQVTRYTGRKTAQECFIQITRDLVRIMQDRTGDGYVFRTDLRLRPDPGATPVALSVDAAEIYYQSVGKNWERAAMIKARTVAGDRATGDAFLKLMTGFVWRKHLDYAAMADIHAIKKLIHQHHRHGPMKVPGHDVKLGRGGIREIEFFAQIQQLISGGREPSLRVRGTLDALQALHRLGRVNDQELQTLTDAYLFLRTLEHRLQMVADEQTHALPLTEEALAHIATFMGFSSRADFDRVLIQHLENVQALYDTLLEPKSEGEGAAPPDAAKFFSVTATDAVARLTSLGFKEAERIHAVIEGWQYGRYRALRTPRAQGLMEKLLPHLLDALSHTGDPDGALMKFDEFLSKLPAGVQLLSLFQANPWLLEVMVEIMSIAPALANELARRPVLLDAVISPDFFTPLSDSQKLAASLAHMMESAQDYQDVLDIARVWTNEQRFRIGVQLLRGTIDGSAAGSALSDVAETVLKALGAAVMADFAKRHGIIRDGRLCVIAMGKFGGRELTFTSDLDLIFIFDADAEAVSDGQRDLAASTYYIRLSQAFVNAITAPTAEGRLFEVDMRLRPSGNAGPLAVSLPSFTKYQHDSAWTWEHMALTRARCILGDGSLIDEVNAVMRHVLASPRPADKLLRDVADMRQRLRKEFGTANMWSVKHCPGGMVDAEFVCQYLQLKHACDHPEVLSPRTGDAIHKLKEAGILDAATADAMAQDYALLHQVQSVLRLCVGQNFDENSAAPGLKAALAKVISGQSFEELKASVRAAEAHIAQLHETFIDAPARALPDPQPHSGA